MPRTIKNYAIDYNKNETIELKIEDSFASANYLKTIGWKKNEPCFIKLNLKIISKKIFKFFGKKYK